MRTLFFLLAVLAVSTLGCGGSGGGSSAYSGNYTGWYGLSVKMPIHSARISETGRIDAIVNGGHVSGQIKDGKLSFDWINQTPVSFDGRTIKGAEIELVKR